MPPAVHRDLVAPRDDAEAEFRMAFEHLAEDEERAPAPEPLQLVEEPRVDRGSGPSSKVSATWSAVPTPARPGSGRRTAGSQVAAGPTWSMARPASANAVRFITSSLRAKGHDAPMRHTSLIQICVRKATRCQRAALRCFKSACERDHDAPVRRAPLFQICVRSFQVRMKLFQVRVQRGHDAGAARFVTSILRAGGHGAGTAQGADSQREHGIRARRDRDGARQAAGRRGCRSRGDRHPGPAPAAAGGGAARVVQLDDALRPLAVRADLPGLLCTRPGAVGVAADDRDRGTAERLVGSRRWPRSSRPSTWPRRRPGI